MRVYHELYEKAIKNGTDPSLLQKWINLNYQKDPTCQPTKYQIASDIDQLFELGGIISGGAALSYITKAFISKDIDFYFNDEVNYLKAQVLTVNNPLIDVNFFIDEPHELHDIGIVMCNLTKDGPQIMKPCKSALETRISNLYPLSVIYPDRTVKRMYKYNKRLGTKFRLHEVITFCALYNIDFDESLKSITV